MSRATRASTKTVVDHDGDVRILLWLGRRAWQEGWGLEGRGRRGTKIEERGGIPAKQWSLSRWCGAHGGAGGGDEHDSAGGVATVRTEGLEAVAAAEPAWAAAAEALGCAGQQEEEHHGLAAGGWRRLW